MKKRILIVLADVGSGHRSAANALINASIEINYDYEIKSVDLFELADVQPFNTSNNTYSLISKNYFFEEVNNLFFRFFNTSLGSNLFTTYTVRLMYEECEKILREESPEVVISVHPIVNMIISAIKQRSALKFKYVTVITDLVTLFKGWADKNADIVFAPTLEAKEILLKEGVKESQIIAPLFPINPFLKKYRDKNLVLKELGFDERLPTVLVTGGGVGTYSLKKVVELLVARKDFYLIVICGKDISLKGFLEKKHKGNKSIKILGFVDNIQDYYNIAEIVVAKPGPATILEIELFNKKAIITKPIGEQEKGNVALALKSPKFRFIGSNWSILNQNIDELKNLRIDSFPSRSFEESITILKNLSRLFEKFS